MKRKLALLIAIGALSFGMMPSHAANGYAAGVFQGTANLPKFPCGTGLSCGGGTFSGKYYGKVGSTTAKGASMTASFSYTEPDTVNSLCAVKGSAAGAINIAGHPGTFTWSRTGLTAVIHFNIDGHAGTAVAAFAPISTGACKPLKPAKITAKVVGAAATTN